MAISILRPQITEHSRILAVSDINGSLDLFMELLHKVSYQPGEDVLVILGDFMENGPSPLATLRTIMQMSECGNVFALLGEKDLIYRELYRNDRNSELLRYFERPGNSLISDMLSESELSVTDEYSMQKCKASLVELYEPELRFLDSLPAIIELPKFIFAHAKILPGNLEDMNTMDAVKGDAFFEKGYGFGKYVILGHWPSQCYDLTKIEANPLILSGKHLITIDGGIGRSRDGQLNCLIIPDSEAEEFSYTYVDSLKKAKVLHTQASGSSKRTIKAPYNEVKILQEETDTVYCRQEKTGESFRIPKEMLSVKNGHVITEDITDYQLRLTEGDIVSVICKTERGYLVKKDGIVGWYYGMLEELPSESREITD